MMRCAGFLPWRMSPSFTLQEGAILIADAHYSSKYPQFYAFLQALEKGDIKTSQLILMGDMFELLFGVIKQTHKQNQKEIDLLNKLSESIEIIYFEGNHDFKLQKLFAKIKVFPIQAQPQIASFGDKKVMLSHGDTQTPLGYQIYTKLIRNTLVLKFLEMIDSVCSHCIINWLKGRGEAKNPCYKIGLFKKIISKRLTYLENKPLDIVIEGHFHQNLSFELYGFEYINLASFACNSKYFIVQSSKEQFFLQETLFKES